MVDQYSTEWGLRCKRKVAYRLKVLTNQVKILFLRKFWPKETIEAEFFRNFFGKKIADSLLKLKEKDIFRCHTIYD